MTKALSIHNKLKNQHGWTSSSKTHISKKKINDLHEIAAEFPLRVTQPLGPVNDEVWHMQISTSPYRDSLPSSSNTGWIPPVLARSKKPTLD
ncbi:hypothetical protein OUZ56_031903 [Daphnia magna]|uniref:Uncharacterized protein n=1 Tax=Daphnia magna TaxID=35525 RepID=A0ABQ9ZVW1_9CRUS|nr:hypothetical protein OUZ56_031903 [Daphnia magna]